MDELNLNNLNSDDIDELNDLGNDNLKNTPQKIEKITIDELRSILKYISKGYEVPKIVKDTIFRAAKYEIEDKGKIVITKRDPDIGRERIQAQYAKVIDGNTIDVNASSVGGFGMDFDGDCSYIYVVYYISSTDLVEKLHIKDLINKVPMVLEGEKTKENGIIIKNYILETPIKIMAVDINTGNIEEKTVTHWSSHENLKMYKICRRPRICQISNFDPFWVSDNHSIIVYDETTNSIIKAKPEDIANNKENYTFLRRLPEKVDQKRFRTFFTIYTENDDQILENDLGYFFGSWLGDGYISYNNSSDLVDRCIGFSNSLDIISKKWIEVLKKISNNSISEMVDRKTDYPNKHDFIKKDGNKAAVAKRSIVTDTKLAQEIIKHFSKGSGGKHLPSWILNVTDEFIYGLVAGYGDTDGTINNNYLIIESKSEQLIRDFSYLLRFRYDVPSSVNEDIKKYIITEGNIKIDKTNNPEEWRTYYTLNVKINYKSKEFFEKVYENMLEPVKREDLRKSLDNVLDVEAKPRITYIPYELVKWMTIKDRKELMGLTNDHTLNIKKKNYCQKEVVIPDSIIDNSYLSDSIKNLLHQQNCGEIEFIPCEFVDIEYDSTMTVGYDLTVEDYYTFSTADGIFLQDTMGVFVPISEEAIKDAKTKLMSATQNSTMNAPNFELSKEMLAGIFTLTMDYKLTASKAVSSLVEIEKLPIDTMVDTSFRGKRIKTTAGRIVFNSNIPSYIDFVDEAVDKKLITSIFSKIISKSKPDYIETVYRLTKIGFRYATEYPGTISLDLLQIPKSLELMKIKLSQEKNVAKQSAIIDEMEKKLLEHLKEHAIDLYIFCKSGASKGTSQLRQIMVAKGLISDADNVVLPPIIKSIGEGYSAGEYFDAAAGSRKGTIDRVISTAKGGYTYRKMIYVVGDVEANIENADCGTRRTLNIKLTPEIYKRLGGRYLEIDKKISRIDKSMIGSIIPLRSPVYCKSRAICKLCYGDLIYQLKSKAVGIIAAQECCSLSERIMKSFHTGGSVSLNTINIFSQLLTNVEDSLLTYIKSLSEQVDNDLISKSDVATIKIDNRYYLNPKYKLERKENEILLPVGYFELALDKLVIPVTIEQPVKIYLTEQVKETQDIINIIYARGDKLFEVLPSQVKADEVAQMVGTLVSGYSPWKSPENLYFKFFELLKTMGNWDSCHLEVIISNILRNKIDPQIPARLKEPYQPVMYPIKDLPSIISYPLGIAFENFSKSLTYGLISERFSPSDIEKIMFGEPLVEPPKKVKKF